MTAIFLKNFPEIVKRKIELVTQNMYNKARICLTGEMTMAEKIILTGDRPTGKLHVGHYVGSPVSYTHLAYGAKLQEIIMESYATDRFLENRQWIRQETYGKRHVYNGDGAYYNS